MIKNIFIAAAILIASPGLAVAQDLFFSFEPDSLVTNLSVVYESSGSVYIFSDAEFGFDAIDLDFLTSNSNVIQFTGGEAFNPTFNTIGGAAFDSSEVTVDASGVMGNLFAVSLTQNGINPPVSTLFNPSFTPSVGPNGAILLARIDFIINQEGTEILDLALGDQGALQLPSVFLDPSLGSATLTSEFPITIPICIGSLGDVNLDGMVSTADIAPFISVLASGGYQVEADCDENGVVNFFDIAFFIEILGNQ